MGILDKITKKKPASKASEAPAKKAPAKKAPAARKATAKPAAQKQTAKPAVVNQATAAYKVLIRPLVTEKSTELAAQGKYVFEVSIRANKIAVAQAVKDVYGADVQQVNIMKTRGKVVAFGRNLGKRKDYKKAIVTLKKGQTIQVFEGV